MECTVGWKLFLLVVLVDFPTKISSEIRLQNIGFQLLLIQNFW